jgi:hypothetical protein
MEARFRDKLPTKISGKRVAAQTPLQRLDSSIPAPLQKQ